MHRAHIPAFVLVSAGVVAYMVGGDVATDSNRLVQKRRKMKELLSPPSFPTLHDSPVLYS
jgi:hypothetical protein